MSKKLTKNRKKILEKINNHKKYSLEEASILVKKISFVNFDASIDISVHLGIDTKLPNQMIRGFVKLPHGTGKNIRILALVPKDKELEVKEAGADYVGLGYIEKIKSGWTKNIDIIITIPSVMPQLGSLGKILGPRGLMPNPKLDTVTMNPGKSIKEIKSGKISFKADRYGIIHVSIGRVSFSHQYLFNNAKEFLNKIIRSKPSSCKKGSYIKSIYLSTTMSSSILVDSKSFIL
ncbi:50S ribosomal protein L1 [Blattabacterium cuenoti]|uniref:50S ribosomal protein L1 n=1 Tax=Blattabacterium cuenoti TaxID=1653831 RepID=UPI00163CDC82|nr:50S ribosomal protein L1 [Blattabacterium cuenoti]